jgi:hypothetical protein
MTTVDDLIFNSDVRGAVCVAPFGAIELLVGPEKKYVKELDMRRRLLARMKNPFCLTPPSFSFWRRPTNHLYDSSRDRDTPQSKNLAYKIPE